MKIVLSKKTTDIIKPEVREIMEGCSNLSREATGKGYEINNITKEEVKDVVSKIKFLTFTETENEYILEIKDDFLIDYIHLYKELIVGGIELIRTNMMMIQCFIVPKIKAFIAKHIAP